MPQSQPELQTLLEQLLGEEPEEKLQVYFQPPENVTMIYPCIRYERDNARTVFANNSPYRFTQRYKVTYISEEPDDYGVLDALKKLPMCTFDRWYAAEGLNHDVFNLYY